MHGNTQYNKNKISSYREGSTGLIIWEIEDRTSSAVRSREKTENRCKSGHECFMAAMHNQNAARVHRSGKVGKERANNRDPCADRARKAQGFSLAVVQIHWLSLWQLSLPHFKCGKTAAQSAVKGCRIGWETALVRARSMAVRG